MDTATTSARFRENPYQPRRFNVPKHSFGQKQSIRDHFNPVGLILGLGSIMTKVMILYYVFIVEKLNRKAYSGKDLASVSKGFSNWKDSTNCFR